jgi:hypothetical protein
MSPLGNDAAAGEAGKRKLGDTTISVKCPRCLSSGVSREKNWPYCSYSLVLRCLFLKVNIPEM